MVAEWLLNGKMGAVGSGGWGGLATEQTTQVKQKAQALLTAPVMTTVLPEALSSGFEGEIAAYVSLRQVGVAEGNGGCMMSDVDYTLWASWQVRINACKGLDMRSGLRAARNNSWLFSSLPETRGESASRPGWALKYLRGRQAGGDGALSAVYK